jgi:transcriptional regulator with XRE-family HTH domain
MFDKRDVALAIRKLRGARTQKEVADLAGIDRPTWNQYEKARAMPKSANFDKLAEGLGCTSRQLDEAIMRAWRERLDREQPESKRGEGDETGGRPATPDGADAFEHSVRHHVDAMAHHLHALFLSLRDELRTSR